MEIKIIVAITIIEQFIINFAKFHFTNDAL